MRLNPLLLFAAAVYCVAGLGLTFAPAELASASRAEATPLFLWACQILGGALLGLAALNFLHRHSVVAGVYGRPILIANLTFLSVAFFATLRTWRADGGGFYLAATLVLGGLFAAFGSRLFARPASAAE